MSVRDTLRALSAGDQAGGRGDRRVRHPGGADVGGVPVCAEQLPVGLVKRLLLRLALYPDTPQHVQCRPARPAGHREEQHDRDQ